MSTPEQNLAQLAVTLPAAPTPGGVYSPCLVVQGLVYVSGHIPFYTDGTHAVGKVGGDGLSKEEAKVIARQVGYNLLATLKENIGSLDKIHRVVKVFGMINAHPDFADHAFVMNGCTELFAEIWGPELGLGTRSAVGMGSLPKGVPVEVEAIFQLA